MKKFLFVIFALLVSTEAFAQANVQTTQLQASWPGVTVASGTQCISLRTRPITGHNFLFTVNRGSGSVSAILVTVTGSTDGGTTFSSLGTSTNTAGATIIPAAAPYTNLCIALTSITGAGTPTVDFSYSGVALGSGGSVTVSGAVTVSSGTIDIGNVPHVVCDSGCAGGTQYTQDGALTVASTIGTMSMGRASAAAPTGVSADDDAVLPWYLRSGAMAIQPTYGGALAVAGNGASGTGVQRVTIANDGTGRMATVDTVTAVTAITNALPSGTNVIGHVIVDSGGGGGSTAQGATTSGVTGGLSMGMVTTSAPTYTNGTINGLSLDTAGALRVSGAGGGTQYTQDGALTVGSTVMTMAGCRASAAAPTAVSADNDAALPWCLLSGANVVQLSNAGVLTVSGSGTATGALRVELPTNGTGVIAGVTTVSTVTSISQLGGVALPIEDAAETAGGVGIYAMTVRRDTAASSAGTTGDNATLNTDSLGRLWVNCGTGCSGGTQYNIDVAAGGSDTGTIALATRDDALTTLTPADGDWAQLRVGSTGALWVQSAIVDAAEGAAVASSPVPVGCVYRTSYTALDAGDVGYPICDVNSRLMTVPTPGIQGGWSSLNATAADSATACTSTVQAIKASQGTFGGYYINNPNTADSWLHIYNVASGSVTVGTTAPALTFRIPGAAANSVAANLEISLGVQFSTAMSMACTTTAGGTGNPSSALEADIFYK